MRRGETGATLVWSEAQFTHPTRGEAMAPEITWTQEVKSEFLENLAETAVVVTAAELTGVSRRQAYNLRESDEEFGAKWDEAISTARERLKAEAFRRAVDGVLEPVGFHQGKHGGEEGEGVFIRRYSDRLLEKLLSAAYPEEFRDNIHHSGDATGGVAAQLQRALDREDGDKEEGKTEKG